MLRGKYAKFLTKHLDVIIFSVPTVLFVAILVTTKEITLLDVVLALVAWGLLVLISWAFFSALDYILQGKTFYQVHKHNGKYEPVDLEEKDETEDTEIK